MTDAPEKSARAVEPPAAESLSARLDDIAAKLLSSINPDAAADEEARKLLAEAVAMAARAEAALEAERSRCDWLMTQVTQDETTGLLNRRGFSDALHRSLARARRYDEAGALILVDLTGLGGINQDFGTGAGDYALGAIANSVRTRFREVDYVARLGGGRFAVLLPKIAADDARRRAAMLKSHLDRLTVPWDGQVISLEVRIGLVSYGQRDAAEDLLERAESELEEREQRVARLRHPAE